jgi:DNA invertase Pin-like site-specific DNA recombinase
VKAKGASLKATNQQIDTSTAAGKCFLDMLGVFAEFETNLRKERQLEGIDAAGRDHTAVGVHIVIEDRLAALFVPAQARRGRGIAFTFAFDQVVEVSSNARIVLSL